MFKHWINPNIFFVSDSQKKTHWSFWACAAVLFLAGAIFWGYFIGWGQESGLHFHDWTDITLPRLTFLQDAIRQGVLPLHISDKHTLNGITDRFLAIPDVIVSPQILLLKWMSVGQFILFDLLLMYSLGFLGLVWIGKKYHLAPLAFTLLVLLFNFNGHILAHIAVGHLTWTGYFLFSWLVGLVLQVFERDQLSWRWVLSVSGLLLVILLQGGYHQFVWSVYLLALMVFVAGKKWLRVVEALVASVLLSAIRTAPAALILGHFGNNFLLGYQSSSSLWDALTVRYIPGETVLNGDMQTNLGTWEVTLFVGALAAGFLIYFGVVQVFRQQGKENRYAVLFLPVIGLVFLSFDRVYKYLRMACPLPIFSGERVSSRIIVLAFVIVLVLAVIEFQHWLNRQPASAGLYLGITGLVGILLNDLWQNSQVWATSYASVMLTVSSFDPARWVVANRVDEPYFSMVKLGVGISLLTLGALVYLCWREGRTVASPVRSKNKPAFQAAHS